MILHLSFSISSIDRLLRAAFLLPKNVLWFSRHLRKLIWTQMTAKTIGLFLTCLSFQKPLNVWFQFRFFLTLSLQAFSPHTNRVSGRSTQLNSPALYAS